jgi:Xaa-Pro aminopeptidase
VLVVFGGDGHGEPFRWLTSFQPMLGRMWLVFPSIGEPSGALDFGWQLDEARQRSGFDRWYGGTDPVSAVVERLRELGSRRASVSGLDRLPAAAWRRLEAADVVLLDAGAELAKLRRVKSELEIACLRLAASATDEAFETVRSELRPGLTEREVAARLGYVLRRGSGEWAFAPVVISGVDDPVPIREPTDRILEEGDTVLVDIGGSYAGYQADASRTWVLGEASATQLTAWDVVVRAHAAAVAAARPGVPCAEVAAPAAAIVRAAGHELPHRIGHGIGLATSFEWPSLDHESALLEPGMTFCLEPSICSPGAGTVKLEDDVVVTATGCELITNASRELQVDV